MKEHEMFVPDTEMGLSEREIKKIRRQVERPIRLARLGTRLGAAALFAGLILKTDIAINELRLHGTEPQIHTISEALSDDYSNHTTFYIDGFAGNDGSWITKKMTPAMQAAHDGNTAALEYDPAGISISAIAREIAEAAENEQLQSVSLHGYSIGGKIALDVAAELIEKYDIQVDRIFLDQSPSSADTIRAAVRDPASGVFVDAMGVASTLGFDLEYSSIARTIFDAAIPQDISHLRNSSTKLMRDQFIYGITTDVEESIAALAEQGSSAPTIIYVTSDSPNRDYMVDLVAAETDYKKLTEEYGLNFTTITVEGVVHSRPDLTLDAYEKAFAEQHDIIEELSPLPLIEDTVHFFGLRVR